jgi:hypothetical protein
VTANSTVPRFPPGPPPGFPAAPLAALWPSHGPLPDWALGKAGDEADEVAVEAGITLGG